MATTACIYLRQSKAQEDSISLELQEAACRTYCAQKGYDVSVVVAEEGVSAFRDWRKRPKFGQVVEAGADVVVVYRWSRLSRRRLDQLNLIELLGRVESANESIDVSTAGGRMSRDMLLSIAAFESDVKSEQFKEALARRVEQGLPKNGHLRFGYRKDPKGGRALVPDPATSHELPDLYRRYAAGAGFQGLCADLNRRGVTTTKGSPWGVQTLMRAMDSGFGAGLLVQDRKSKPAGEEDTWLPGVHEAVVSPRVWEAYRAARATRRVAAPKRRTNKWHLSGVAYCGLCEARLVVSSYTARHSLALCSTYVNSRACAGVWMSRPTLEREVAMWLGGRLDQVAAELPQRDAERASAQTQRDEAARALDDAVASLGRLQISHARGVLDEQGFLAAQAELRAERDAAQTVLSTAREEVSRLAPPQSVFDAMEKAPEMLPAEYGALIGRVLRRVEVAKGTLRFVPVVGEAQAFER